VKIGGGGLYAGELAIVESLSNGVIPAAAVRTDTGKTRRIRAVDLERVTVVRPRRAPRPSESPRRLTAEFAT